MNRKENQREIRGRSLLLRMICALGMAEWGRGVGVGYRSTVSALHWPPLPIIALSNSSTMSHPRAAQEPCRGHGQGEGDAKSLRGCPTEGTAVWR